MNDTIAVSRFAATAWAIPYTDEVGENVVDVLFQIAHLDLLRPHMCPFTDSRLIYIRTDVGGNLATVEGGEIWLRPIEP